MKNRLDALVNEMLDGHILLSEALAEFEKVFIEKALERNNNHISNTADVLGVHRNTVAKRIASYNGSMRRRQAVKWKKR
jgi:DNA-binding NtrC family response regulator